MALLRIQTGPRSGSFVSLVESSLTIGRGERVALRLPDHGSSRQHAEIFRIGELHFIRDLQSRNGTFVNDRKVSEVILREGDHIRIGDTVMLFLDREESPQARVIRLQNGSGGLDTVRFRDTVVGTKPLLTPAPPRAKPEARKDLLRRVSQTIAEESSLKAVLDRVIRELAQAIEADRGDILLIESPEPEARYRAAATYDTKGEGEVMVSRTILAEACERKEAILSADAATDQRFGEAQSVITHAIHSVICVPMIAAGDAAGVIYLCNSKRPEAFDREDLELAAQVGLQLSAILGMLKLFESRGEVLRSSLHLAARALWPTGDDPANSESERAPPVARLSRAIAHALALAPEDVDRAWAAGMLHGLFEAGSGAAESSLRRRSAGIPGMDVIVDAIECQDERHDGSGVPRGRTGDEIPLLGRVLSLAKEIDRLSREKGADGEPRGLDQALAAIRDSAGTKFHSDAVQACLVARRNGYLVAPGPEGLYLGI